MSSEPQKDSEIPVSLIASMVDGVLGVLSVLLGIRYNIPGFSIRSGFWGANWLSGFLYALGNDTLCTIIVSAIWLVYGALTFGTLASLILSAKRE